MQMIDSRTQKLSGEQIIEVAARNTKVDRPIEQVKEMLTIEFKMPNTWKMREGNTIFICHKTQQAGYGYFRALNADTAQNFLQNSRVFADAAYKVGFDVLVTQFQDSSLLGLFKMISRNPVREGMGYAAKKIEDGGFQVTLVLGPARGGKK
jgi:hypothetical protein